MIRFMLRHNALLHKLLFHLFFKYNNGLFQLRYCLRNCSNSFSSSAVQSPITYDSMIPEDMYACMSIYTNCFLNTINAFLNLVFTVPKGISSVFATSSCVTRCNRSVRSRPYILALTDELVFLSRSG